LGTRRFWDLGLDAAPHHALPQGSARRQARAYGAGERGRSRGPQARRDRTRGAHARGRRLALRLVLRPPASALAHQERSHGRARPRAQPDRPRARPHRAPGHLGFTPRGVGPGHLLVAPALLADPPPGPHLCRAVLRRLGTLGLPETTTRLRGGAHRRTRRHPHRTRRLARLVCNQL
jgi:hypothetical protein